MPSSAAGAATAGASAESAESAASAAGSATSALEAPPPWRYRSHRRVPSCQAQRHRHQRKCRRAHQIRAAGPRQCQFRRHPEDGRSPSANRKMFLQGFRRRMHPRTAGSSPPPGLPPGCNETASFGVRFLSLLLPPGLPQPMDRGRRKRNRRYRCRTVYANPTIFQQNVFARERNMPLRTLPHRWAGADATPAASPPNDRWRRWPPRKWRHHPTPPR